MEPAREKGVEEDKIDPHYQISETTPALFVFYCLFLFYKNENKQNYVLIFVAA